MVLLGQGLDPTQAAGLLQLQQAGEQQPPHLEEALRPAVKLLLATATPPAPVLQEASAQS